MITLPLAGVYVVALDPEITGPENIFWAFSNGADAAEVVSRLEAAYGEGRAWSTYEPVALGLGDPDLAETLRDELGDHARAPRGRSGRAGGPPYALDGG